MVRLAEYSRDVLREMRAERWAWPDDRRSQGALQLFRTQKQLDGTGADIRGAESATACASNCSRPRRCHPPTNRRWRAMQDKVPRRPAAARDETGDCASRFRKRGPRLRHQTGGNSAYGTSVEGLLSEGQPASAASSPTGARSAPMPTSSRWAATRPSCSRAAPASPFPSIRSGAIRSPCPSSMQVARPDPP